MKTERVYTEVDDKLYARATRAWMRDCKRKGLIFDQPSQIGTCYGYNGLTYVVLENCNGIIAVYLEVSFAFR
jgi:hypothetical protein